jgi:LacI family transcriptional regulator
MRISSSAQHRVRQAVADLGYRPNRTARILRTATTKTIGVISDFVASGQFGSHMLAGASAAAREVDHVLVIGETQGDDELEASLIDEMIDRQVDGIVYARVVTAEIDAPPALADHRTVLLNCVDPASSITAVLPDERAGGRAAAEVMIRAGRAHDLVVVGEDPTPRALAGPLRVAGIGEALAAHGHAVRATIASDWAVAPAYDAVHAWLASGQRAAGFICLNDRISMGAYQALAEFGLRVPEDVSIVSFDGSELSAWLRPSLTSVALPYARLGAEAVRLLMDPEGATAGVVRVSMPVLTRDSIALQ